MANWFKYTAEQGQFLVDNIEVTNKKLAILFEEKFGINITTKYLANFKYRVSKKTINTTKFNTKIGESYVNKDSRISEEISKDIKENANLFREMAKRGVKKWNLEQQ